MRSHRQGTESFDLGVFSSLTKLLGQSETRWTMPILELQTLLPFLPKNTEIVLAFLKDTLSMESFSIQAPMNNSGKKMLFSAALKASTALRLPSGEEIKFDKEFGVAAITKEEGSIETDSKTRYQVLVEGVSFGGMPVKYLELVRPLTIAVIAQDDIVLRYPITVNDQDLSSAALGKDQALRLIFKVLELLRNRPATEKFELPLSKMSGDQIVPKLDLPFRVWIREVLVKNSVTPNYLEIFDSLVGVRLTTGQLTVWKQGAHTIPVANDKTLTFGQTVSVTSTQENFIDFAASTGISLSVTGVNSARLISGQFLPDQRFFRVQAFGCKQVFLLGNQCANQVTDISLR